jgi:hypothetical protein
MIGRHALRGALTAWMCLIVLQAAGSAGGSGKLATLFTDVNRLVQRALSPDVPAIPDRRNTRGTAIVTADGTPTGGYLSPGGGYLPPSDNTIPQPQPAPGDPRLPHNS